MFKLFKSKANDIVQFYQYIELIFFQVDLEADREVSYADGNTLATDWGCPFFETSAKNKKNVDQLFAEIVRETNYMSHPQKGGGCCVVL